ncbi:hypothetical protein L6Q21_03735 [Sandaracinobacter sp. RS1-74]|uniref:hypothetical protein n=1 Tax=Sandaracinobacteroides sayramensis TaxID=2913411 RepID=UPI001EDB50D6|nr:hypothetical protein [Sandaracinobacteroides sayramensis]MCG2840096.1 hypothetical protein [Sandaracinobacteroides sayramensis]
MGFWEAVVLIVAIVVIGKVMSGGRWNKEKGRWERHSPDNPYVRASAGDEVTLLRKEIVRLNERVQTLEKIAIDPSRQLSDEIERLRHSPPRAGGNGHHTDA